ncbi:MAG: hypothetical protein WD042_04935 [Phycisphaeraceae bacterium]
MSAKQWIRLAVIVVAATLGLIIIFQNWQPVETYLLWFQFRGPLIGTLVLAMLLGFILGLTLPGLLRWRKKP